MSVVITVEIEAAGGDVSTLVAEFARVLPDTRAFEGCEMIEVLTDTGRPGFVSLLERWASLANYQAYKAWRAESGTSVAAGPHVAGTPVVRVYDVADA